MKLRDVGKNQKDGRQQGKVPPTLGQRTMPPIISVFKTALPFPAHIYDTKTTFLRLSFTSGTDEENFSNTYTRFNDVGNPPDRWVTPVAAGSRYNALGGASSTWVISPETKVARSNLPLYMHHSKPEYDRATLQNTAVDMKR